MCWIGLLLSSGGGEGFEESVFFVPRNPRSRNSQKALRRKTPEILSIIRLSNSPSTVVNVPLIMIEAIPARGMRPSKMEIRSITGANVPPRGSADRSNSFMEGLGFESYVDGLAVLGCESDFLGLLAELFVDEGDGVVAGGQALDFELAVGAGDRKERALGDVDEHAHPGMLVALHGQHDLFAGEGFLECGSLRRLRLVPLAVVLGGGMNIVGGRIAVDDFYGLTGHDAQHVGMVFAAALIEGDGILGNVERAVAEAFFHVHKHVGEMAPAGHHVFSCVRAFARGILAHVNHGGLGRGTFELYNADDRGCRGGINRSRRGRGRRSNVRRGLLFRAFLFAAACEEDKSQQSCQAPNCCGCFRFHFFAAPLLKFESSNQLKIYSGAPRPALPAVFPPGDALPASAPRWPRARPHFPAAS